MLWYTTRQRPSELGSSLLPGQGLLHLQFLITCSMQKWKKTLGNLSWDLQHNSDMLLHLLSTAIGKWFMKPILHSLLATKIVQVPAESYTKRMKHIQAKSHGEKKALFGVAPLICTSSIPQRLSFKPGYVLQVELISPLEPVLVL